jgi:glutathione S-transferase
VSLVYEDLLRPQPLALWSDRCRAQIFETLDLLERERQASPTSYWLGESLSHVDIALTCALRFTREAMPALLPAQGWPALSAAARACEELPAFREICQPFEVKLTSEQRARS